MNDWITGPLMIEVYYVGDPLTPPFVCGVDGPITSGGLDDIERVLAEELTDGELFADGAGSYHIRCMHNEAQRDGYGRVEMPAHWEFDRIGFQAMSEPPALGKSDG